MAEAILRSKSMENVSVRSAGIHALDGYPIADNARTLIEEAEMPYTNNSRTLSQEDVEWADYILTMTESHKRVLLQLFPQDQEKIYTLKGFISPYANEDVHDPYGGNLETYRETFNELTQLMNQLEKKLLERDF